MPLASARQHPGNQKENQAGHSSERTVEGRKKNMMINQTRARPRRSSSNKRSPRPKPKDIGEPTKTRGGGWAASQRFKCAIVWRWLFVVDAPHAPWHPDCRPGHWVPRHAVSRIGGRGGRASRRPELHLRRRRGLRARGSGVSRLVVVVCRRALCRGGYVVSQGSCVPPIYRPYTPPRGPAATST